MDIHSTKGQHAHQAAQFMAESLGYRWRWAWFATPSDVDSAAARVDGCFVRYHPDRAITAIAECKARTQPRTFFDGVSVHPGHYILTEDKITHGLHASRTFGVPFLLLVYLIPDMAAHVFPISNAQGELLVDYVRDRTETRATVNGGTASRWNAYIPFDYAHVYDLQGERAEQIKATLPL